MSYFEEFSTFRNGSEEVPTVNFEIFLAFVSYFEEFSTFRNGSDKVPTVNFEIFFSFCELF